MQSKSSKEFFFFRGIFFVYFILSFTITRNNEQVLRLWEEKT